MFSTLLPRFASPALAAVAFSLLAITCAPVDPPTASPPTATRPATTQVSFKVYPDSPSAETVVIDLVRLRAGKVTLTDAKGRQAEHAIKPIWMGKYETTWGEFYAFARGWDLTDAERRERKYRDRLNRPEHPPDAGWGIVGFPANNITLSSAKKYCEWLSAKTGKRFRLPTEAEWEYACRAGGPVVKLEKNPAKPQLDALKEVAWFADNSEDQAHEVGKKKPNAWGLYDMLGNVAEHVIMPDGAETIAGGSWKDEAEDVHGAAREARHANWWKRDPQFPHDPDWYDFGSAHYIGFRVVMEE